MVPGQTTPDCLIPYFSVTNYTQPLLGGRAIKYCSKGIEQVPDKR